MRPDAAPNGRRPWKAEVEASGNGIRMVVSDIEGSLGRWESHLGHEEPKASLL
jgi:hypothetical protein